MDSLIERIEAATEGSRELDALIWLAACPPDYTFGLDEETQANG